MDVSGFPGGTYFVKHSELLESGPIDLKIESVSEEESLYGDEGETQVVVHCSSGRKVALGADRLRHLVSKYGTDTDEWIDKRVMAYCGKVRGKDAIRFAEPGSDPIDLVLPAGEQSKRTEKSAAKKKKKRRKKVDDSGAPWNA